MLLGYTWLKMTVTVQIQTYWVYTLEYLWVFQLIPQFVRHDTYTLLQLPKIATVIFWKHIIHILHAHQLYMWQAYTHTTTQLNYLLKQRYKCTNLMIFDRGITCKIWYKDTQEMQKVHSIIIQQGIWYMNPQHFYTSF